ncbi:MAG: bifunctional phosphoribosylaminoimidazolecarboxamide formyltransferase/IMP cyclohydrolase [Spirochaetaceae bacterium]|jgi:phosphoribosylaminoimidazolecarboxamide formyltransferase/IMP cyclohydrolase|nr:bifunctional phosphoribosylaminoimidazolecarboxamide formyltransferase/IMP cyclohydrolase [Spirochaetaceae bacterium]
MKTALISVYEKDGILELACFLNQTGWRILSTGETGAFLRENGLEPNDISDITAFPEYFDRGVEMFRPAIAAGVLAPQNESSPFEAIKNLDIKTIDLVCVNLHPFLGNIVEGIPEEEGAEFIDVGGPSLLRSAAKNFKDVLVLSDPADYGSVIDALKAGAVPEQLRKYLAGKAFSLISAYDATISGYLLDEDFPEYRNETLKKKMTLRYGENEHQKAALYFREDTQGAFPAMEFLGGKEFSYNNIRDMDLAWKTVCSFGLPSDGTLPFGYADSRQILPDVPLVQLTCFVVVKHNTPCGVTLAGTAEEAYTKAYLCNPMSIFGSVLACNMPISADLAEKLNEIFLETIIAPDYEPRALDILRKKKDLRIVKAKNAPKEPLEVVSVDGGILVQEVNRHLLEKWDIVTDLAPEPRFIPDMLFGIRAVNWVKSSAIVVVKDRATVGISGGEPNRIWAAELALNRAAKAVAAIAEAAAFEQHRETGLYSPNKKIYGNLLAPSFVDAEPARVFASDSFIPFPDVIEAAAAAGIKAVIQSGGSSNDALSIEACNRLGIAMIFTGARYFRH